jgi:hypothetical protein
MDGFRRVRGWRVATALQNSATNKLKELPSIHAEIHYHTEIDNREMKILDTAKYII